MPFTTKRTMAAGRAAAQARPVRVFLLEDHEIVRRGVAEMLRLTGDIEVVGTAADLAEARALLPELAPDVAVVDVRLPDGSGLEYCRELRGARPDVACLVFSSYSDRAAVLTAALAGASGYLLKTATGDMLAQAVLAVAGGQNLLADEAKTVVDTLQAFAIENGCPLTARENAVRLMLLRGLSDREIAMALGTTAQSVRADVSTLLAKTISPTATWVSGDPELRFAGSVRLR